MSRVTLLSIALLLCGQAGAREQALSVPAGVQVKLILLRPLESGKTGVKSNVPFTVAEDVKDAAGNVVLPQGSYAVGTVVASRGEGPLSASLLDRPARLAITFDYAFDANGRQIPLVASLEDPKKPHMISRNATGQHYKQSKVINAVLAKKENRRILEKLLTAVSDGSFNPSESEKTLLYSMLVDLEMTRTAEFVRDGKLPDLIGFGRKLMEARSMEALAAGPTVGTVAAGLRSITEIAGLGARSVGYVKGRLKGRNIRAHPGYVFTAYMAGA